LAGKLAPGENPLTCAAPFLSADLGVVVANLCDIAGCVNHHNSKIDGSGGRRWEEGVAVVTKK